MHPVIRGRVPESQRYRCRGCRTTIPDSCRDVYREGGDIWNAVAADGRQFNRLVRYLRMLCFSKWL